MPALRTLARRVRRFARLRPAEQRAFGEALVLLAATRASLALLPFQAVRRLSRLQQRLPRLTRGQPLSPDRIGWTVSAASLLVPGTTCLPQALVARALLVRAGHKAELHLGVEPPQPDRFRAHAWVESGGRVVVGGHGGRFQSLGSLSAPPGDSGRAA